MLLRNANNCVFSNLDVVGNFVIVNINDFSHFEFFVMRYTVSHYNNFSGFDILFNLFSGNNYFIFLDKRSYYDDLLDFFSDTGSKFEILAVCWHNYFANYSNRIFNISNNILLLFFSCMFFACFFFFLFFSKLMTIYVKINISESKDWC